jgi:ubiquinone/menaquinone biosynthesis C-methylase UbiE
MKDRAPNNFDSIAPYYDRIARFVFGKSIVNAQVEHLDQIPPRATLLILGGGTGWILDVIEKCHNDCKIYFIDASSQMISFARDRQCIRNQIIFIHGTEENIPNGISFDVVITNFYLDLFDTCGVKKRVKFISNFCSDKVVWIATDFVMAKWWHRFLLWIMYRFFKMTSRIEAHHLPDWKGVFKTENFILTSSKFYSGDFIISCVLRRTQP